jgi:hypothetical protein
MQLVSVCLVIVCLMVSVLESVGFAEPVEVAFSGVIVAVEDPFLELPAGITVGAPFSGSYYFDSLAPGPPDPLSGPPVVNIYPPNGALSVVVGGNPFTTPSIGVAVFNDAQISSPSPEDLWTHTFSGCGCIEAGVFFQDVTGTALMDGGYFVNDSLAGWTFGELVLARPLPPPATENEEFATGTITSVEIVPEPSNGLLALAGILELIGLARWRRRHAKAGSPAPA